MRHTLRFLTLLLALAAWSSSDAWAQNVCASPGKDGAGSINTNPNTYYPGVTATAGATSITVGTARSITATAPAIGANDLLLIIQMQGADISTANSNAYGDGVTGDPANGYLTAGLTAGQYEYVVASGTVSGTGVVNISSALQNTYTTSAVGTTATLRTFQVVRVPQYTTLTLTGNVSPLFWNGTTGGITAVDVQGLMAFGNFKLDASALGFRGGAGIKQTYNSASSRVDYLTTAASNLNAQKGEGIAGSPQYLNYVNGVAGSAYTLLSTTTDNYPGGSSGRGAPGNAGGGGNDNGNNSGGGGGANGGTGGHGGYSSINSTPGNAGNNTLTSYIGGEPGAAFTSSSSSRLVMGGGGGAGTTNDGTGNSPTNNGFISSGTPGGGIVIVRAGTVSGTTNGTGGIAANGGAVPTGVLNDGGGGAGAGGTILLTVAGSQTGLTDLTMSAIGGTGGTVNPGGGTPAGTAHGPGGGGGGGVVLTSGATKTALTTSTAGGTNGTTTPAGTGTGYVQSAFGATAGTDGSGQSSASTSNTIANSASGAACSTINGTIFDDVNYGGGAGRSLSTSGTSATNSGVTNAIGSVGTTVELYDNTGAFVATTTTTTGGAYSFTGLTYTTNYTVRVVNGTVKSARTPGATGLSPVQTFRTTAYTGTGLGTAVADGSRVGGEAPEKQDAAAHSGTQTLTQLTAGTATPQSIAVVRPGTSGVDFGYNFDVVVNVNDAGQGSLRQFITNANALGNEAQLAQAGSYTNAQNLATGSTTAGLAGVALPAGTESSIFMIPAARLTNGVAVITTASVLPQVNSANLSINGGTQTFNIGNTNDLLLGAGGTVGTASTALSQLNGPEVQLVGARAGTGLELVAGATNATVRGLSIYGYAQQIGVATDVTNTLIEQNTVGTTARSFADPGAGVRGTEQGIYLFNSDNGIIRNNLIGYNGGMGIWVYGSTNGANNNSITNNELRGNGQEVLVGTYPTEGLVFDGLELQGASTGNTVSGNLITQSMGHGIDSAGNGVGGNIVQDNTISNNGQGIVNGTGVEGSGLRVFGATNTTTIQRNVLSGNNGSGVLVEGTANNVTISQNSTFGNTRLGIDLLTTAEGNTAGTTFYNGTTGTATNVSVNDNGDGDTGGNGVLNFPVITSAILTSNGLLVQGFARPGSTIELFAADGAANGVAANVGFGQGRTYLGTFTEGGTTGTSPDTNSGTGTYTSPVNGLNQGTDNTNAFSFLIPLTGNFAGFAAGTTLTSTATINNSTSEFSGNATVAALTGYVYEDVNYGGGAGRPRSASGTVGRPGATVELYNGTTLVSTTTTDANGLYTFGATPGTYTVRVVNSTVSSSRTGYTTALLPVQTYNGTTTAVGGANPAFTDAAANTGSQSLTALSNGTVTPESIATITTTNAATTGPDFGYNFDTVVNTNNAGQGSLRQFIANANALGGEATLAQAGSYTNAVNLATGSTTAGRAGVALPTGIESSIFMIPAGQLTGGVAVITPTTALPQITGVNTAINGATQTFNIGNTNDLLLGAGGTVGTGSTTLNQLNGPEVQLVGSTTVLTGLNIAGAGSQVMGLAIYGFGNNVDDNGNANIATSANNVTITANALGSTATSFAAPAVANGSADVRVASGTGISFTNNLVGFAGGSGIYLAPAVTGATITGNEIRGNGRINTIFDGIDSHGSSTTATGNLFVDGAAQGFDSFSSTGSNTVTGNTFTNNGIGNATSAPQETAAARFYGTGNTFSQNVSTGNYGAGVEVASGTTVISRNSIYNNGNVASANNTAASGEIGIDLVANGENQNTGNSPYVTLNSATTTGGNGLLNYPILRTATVTGTNLVLTGYAKAGATIELFLAQANPAGINATGANFGQGRTFLATVTEGGTFNGVADTDPSTGQAYSGSINGVNQGSDTNASGFSVSIPLANLTAAQRTALLSGSAVLTSTATLASSTSEFSGNLALPVADVTTALAGPATLSPGQPTGTYTATFTNEGPNAASNVGRTVTLPAGATNIIVNGVAYTPTTANTIDFTTATTLASGASNAYTFSFTPATTATGSVAITSNVTSATSQGVNTAPDASTINATVPPTADVVATITATTTSVAAGTLRTASTPPTFTVVFNNNGPNPAAGVAASVQLPTGLTNVNATNNGVYNSATGVVTYASLTAIASGTPTTSVITFDAPATGPVVASATISTTTSEAGRTANNQAPATMAIAPAFDLTTSLSGPASAVAGDLVTLNVTTTNNGPSAAANAVQTVQLTAGLANVYVSNGGVYNPAATTQTIVANGVSYSVPAGGVIFPTLASLATGQSVANSISFAMPGTAFAPTALVTPNSASTATTAGDTNTGNNAANLNTAATGTPAASLAVAAPQTGTSNAYTTIRTSAATTTVGTAVTLTVTTGNNGPNPATDVTQTVQILPGFTVATLQVNGISGTLNAGVITFGTNGPTYNTLTGVVTFPTLANGANGSASATSVTNTITLTPSAATATTVATTGSNGQLLAMATVRTTNTDPVAADNVASVAVTVAQAADLVATIEGPASASAGQLVTYTAMFVNNGPLAAAGVTETAQLPAGLGTNGVTITDAAGTVVSGATYNSTTGLVTFPSVAAAANGATQVFKLTFAAPAQSFTPRSSVASTSADAAPANNSASVATSVAAAADLAVLVSGPATAAVGNPVTYTVTTTNNGPLAAPNATTTLQLAAGFDATTLRVNGATGVLSGTTVTYTFGAGATATTATYSTTTGLVTFPATASLANGTSAANYVTFVMPNAAGGQTTGVASASAAGFVDPVAANNSASVATSIAPTTTTTADLVAGVTVPAASVAPGATVTFTATYSNNGPDAGVNVLPTLQLMPGLTTTTLPQVNGGAGTLASDGTITFPVGASYNPQTGLLTFPAIASQAATAAGNVSYSVQVVAPANGPLVATAATSSNTSEPNTATAQGNNVNSASATITPSFNEVTSISGPATAIAGTSQTYTVTTTNNGPSATTNATTQTVTVPAGQMPTNITNGGVYAGGSTNTITWTIPAGQPAGSNGAVANSFTIVQPAAGTTLTASVTVTGESNTADNTASLPTSATDLAPLAYAVVNALQSPQSNEAGGQANGLLISPLNASDPEGTFATQKYTIVAAPSTAQGTLYYLNGGTYTTVADGQTLTDAQAQTLRFKATAGYVGNASFTYRATDAAGNLSPTVGYTIPVESDVDAVAYTLTPVKGGATPYVVGDVIAFTTDDNGAIYDAATASVYQANGTLQTNANNGIASASAVAGTFTSSRAGVTSLADIGLSVDATGRIVVSNPGTSANPNLRAGTYSVQILTTDANGGQTTRTVSFVIPAYPLPVVLTAFTATAVANRDAQLSWNTASEVNSAYFDVERSLDGISYTKLGQLAAKGTTASASTYAFLDKGVASQATGPVYYRLQQVDLDGKSVYSPVRTVSFTKAAVATLSLYPNPAQQATGLDLSQLPATGTYQVLLLDATGRTVLQATLGGGQVQPLDLGNLATGTYHVLVTGTQPDGSALRQSLRLTKE